MVMSRDKQVNKLLAEAELSHENTSVLKNLLEQPDWIARHEPPPQYQIQLLAALKTRTTFEFKRTPEVTSFSQEWRAGLSKFLKLPQLSWSVAGVMAILVVVLSIGTFLNNAPPFSQDTDLLASTAVRGGEELVDSWIESVGDAGHRMANGGRDLASILHNLENMGDKRAVKEALTNVAASMGYDNGI